MKCRVLLIINLCLTAFLFSQDASWEYLGQKLPGDIPEIFAEGIISTNHMEHSSPTFSPDLKEVYWSIIDSTGMMIKNYDHTIMYMCYDNGKWSDPDTAYFSGRNDDDSPMFSIDGRRLYFSRKINGNFDIFYIKKKKGKWSMPINIGLPINSEKDESQQSISKNKNMYFSASDIYCSEYKKGKYQVPFALASSINSPDFNWTPFIAADESYIIISSNRNPDRNDWGDLYISFKMKNNEWSEAIYMGDTINTSAQERFPYVSPDGKYFFFKRGRYKTFGDVMWMDAGIIERLRVKVTDNR